jgi:hypothetical protein
MNNQEQKKQASEKPQDVVDNRRRFIKGAGIATPMVLTLASRSVLGAQCLSQIMSGNISNVGNGSCELGNSPGGWKTPVGKTLKGDDFVHLATSSTVSISLPDVTKTVDATWTETINKRKIKKSGTVDIKFKITQTKVESYNWAGNIFKYGDLKTYENKVLSITISGTSTLITSTVTVTNAKQTDLTVGATFKKDDKTTTTNSTCTNPTTTKQCCDFTDGDTFQFAFGAGSSDSMREILCDDPGSEASHLVAAMLNAHYYANYVLSVDQVKALFLGTMQPPNNMSLNDFLDSTWGS